MAYCFIHYSDPGYLLDLVKFYWPSRILRSSADSFNLCTPHIYRKMFGKRSFSLAAPSVWNSLPLSISSAPTESSFRSVLKTHLFRNIFCWILYTMNFICSIYWKKAVPSSFKFKSIYCSFVQSCVATIECLNCLCQAHNAHESKIFSVKRHELLRERCYINIIIIIIIIQKHPP